MKIERGFFYLERLLINFAVCGTIQGGCAAWWPLVFKRSLLREELFDEKERSLYST